MVIFEIPKALIPCDATTVSQIKFGSQTVALSFNYDDSITPQISSLNIRSASPILKGEIIMSGNKFTTLTNTKVYLVQGG